MRRVPSLLNWIWIVFAVAATGVAYNLLFSRSTHAYIGVIYALSCGLPLIAFERRMFLPRLHDWLQRLPTLSFVIAALVLDIFMIALGFAFAGTLLKSVGIMTGTWREVTILPADVCIYALAMTAVLVFVMRVRELLGRDVFTSLLTSRYRNPVAEERIFLFVDLAGSTAYAEKFGDLRAQQFLGALFSAFAAPVRRHKGAIDDYIGDAAIITWPMKRGIKHACCVRCIFDILADIEANAAMWRETYGQVPQLRAALHGGSIITAEIGVDHHKITYFGDTVNTTARLEALCKTLEVPLLISSDLAARLTLPDGIVAKDLGEHAVKGRGQKLGVMALGPARSKPSLRVVASGTIR